MPFAIGSTSVIAEITRTVGTGPYVPAGPLPRAARFSEFFSPGESLEYITDDGGSLAEYGTGLFHSDGTISRDSIEWSTSGGLGGALIDWPDRGRRTIRARVSATGGGTASIRTINGFWDGTVPASQRIERYLFNTAATLLAGMPGSLARADTPVAGAVSNIVTQTGDQVVDHLGNFLVDSTGVGAAVVFEIRKNGGVVGLMTFNPGITTAGFTFAADVGFLVGDLFELVGSATPDPNLADIVWNILLAS
jgi:hypothetical protein